MSRDFVPERKRHPPTDRLTELGRHLRHAYIGVAQTVARDSNDDLSAAGSGDIGLDQLRRLLPLQQPVRPHRRGQAVGHAFRPPE
jgi:hypothetical protein